MDLIHTALVSLLIGISSIIIADFLLDDDDARRERWRWMQDVFKVNSTDMALLGVLLVIIVLTYGARQFPAEQVVQQTFALVEDFGLLVVAIASLHRGISSVMFSAEWSAINIFGSMVYGFVCGLAAYSVVLWIIGATGNDIYQWAVANQE